MEPTGYQNLTPSEAIAYQHQLRNQLQIKPLDAEIKIIAGADISFNKYSDVVYAGIVLFSYPDLKIIGNATAISKTTFPYISGLLAFREVPALLEAWNKLELKPDVLILDGQGIAHSRRIGIAAHFGLVTGNPTIGSAKSRLIGKYEEPGKEIFDQSYLYDKGEIIGTALRSKKNCNLIYVSPGNLIGIEQSVNIIKNCLRGYRIPEPTRQAHLLVNKIRIEHGESNNTQVNLFD